REVRPEYERNSPRMSSNSYVNLKIATCLVRYADDRLIDQRFPKARFMQQCVALVTGNQIVSLHGQRGCATAKGGVDGAGTRANLTKTPFAPCRGAPPP
ncbi:hypothetical protein QZM76_11925, partial [Burkholderia multivorans]|nr:hypothetical protein [Burkholderia multivorans]